MVNFTQNLEKAMQEFSSHGGFLTVKGDKGVNTMTVSWGFIGFMWEKPQFITVVRPQRYTKDILDSNADCFSISIPFGNKLKEELIICGTQSGRDIDKSKVVNFIPPQTISSPVVADCDLYYECRINTTQIIDVKLLPPNIAKTFYDNDFHHYYIGEIVDCYGAKN